jgi:hypothetical protein
MKSKKLFFLIMISYLAGASLAVRAELKDWLTPKVILPTVYVGAGIAEYLSWYISRAFLRKPLNASITFSENEYQMGFGAQSDEALKKIESFERDFLSVVKKRFGNLYDYNSKIELLTFRDNHRDDESSKAEHKRIAYLDFDRAPFQGMLELTKNDTKLPSGGIKVELSCQQVGKIWTYKSLQEAALVYTVGTPLMLNWAVT